MRIIFNQYLKNLGEMDRKSNSVVFALSIFRGPWCPFRDKCRILSFGEYLVSTLSASVGFVIGESLVALRSFFGAGVALVTPPFTRNQGYPCYSRYRIVSDAELLGKCTLKRNYELRSLCLYHLLPHQGLNLGRMLALAHLGKRLL